MRLMPWAWRSLALILDKDFYMTKIRKNYQKLIKILKGREIRTKTEFTAKKQVLE